MQLEPMPPPSRAGLGDLDIELLLEPGRFLIAQAGALITRVLYVKQNGAKTFVITDARHERPHSPDPLPGASRNCAGLNVGKKLLP